jgi:hypothetical protein
MSAGMSNDACGLRHLFRGKNDRKWRKQMEEWSGGCEGFASWSRLELEIDCVFNGMQVKAGYECFDGFEQDIDERVQSL